MKTPSVHPESFALNVVPWQLFGTLTWGGDGSFKEPPSRRKQLCKVFAFLRTAAKLAGVHFKSVVWVLRFELGEATGREHLHFLLSVPKAEWVNQNVCFTLMAIWERKLRCGFSRVRVFNAKMSGLAYTLKDLELLSPADRYEFGKFSDKGAELMLSESLKKYVAVKLRGTCYERQCVAPTLSH